MSLPAELSPMLPVAAREVPAEESGWAYEVKFDGFRALAFCSDGQTRLQSRSLKSMTFFYPELAPLAAVIGRSCLLDGEIVAFNEAGRPDFERMQTRTGFFPDESRIRRPPGLQYPICYQVFDLLYLDERSLLSLPYSARRARLEELGLLSEHWMVPSIHRGAGGQALLQASRAAGLEGLVAKRLDSAYFPGQRSDHWRRIKNWCRQEFVIGGYKEDPEGADGWLGGLMLGCFQGDELHYAGTVEVGFAQETVGALKELLPRLERPRTLFVNRQAESTHVYLEPVLVCEVQFLDWTSHGKIRQASFKGFVLDKEPRCVVREVM